MDSVAKWIRRMVAVIVALFSFVIFVPVGGFFYVFLLVRATVSLTLASFLSAMTGRLLSSSVQDLLEQSVSFFPKGLNIIWEVCQSIWNGTDFGRSSQRYDAVTLLTNVILAILFFVIVIMFLEAIGWSVIRVPTVVGWFFGAPILLLLFLGLFAIVGFFVWQIFKDPMRRLWPNISQSDRPKVD